VGRWHGGACRPAAPAFTRSTARLPLPLAPARRPSRQERAAYSAAFDRLRALKGEIQHLQALLEGSRRRLQADFWAWAELMRRQAGAGGAACTGGGCGSGSGPAEGCAGAAGMRLDAGGAEAAVLAAASRQPAGAMAQPQRPLEQLPAPGPSSPTCAGSSGRSRAHARPRAQTPRGAAPAAVVAAAVPAPSAVAPAPSAAALAAAAPHLTGNAAADADIVRFYEARDRLLCKLGAAAAPAVAGADGVGGGG
jgi:kinesin family protein 6/9